MWKNNQVQMVWQIFYGHADRNSLSDSLRKKSAAFSHKGKGHALSRFTRETNVKDNSLYYFSNTYILQLQNLAQSEIILSVRKKKIYYR